jgi:hypothetical protein
MLESKILPTILIILPSSVFLLLAHPGAGKAAAQCNTRPSSSAPQGTHWYYRINSADNRRCWFLSSEGNKVRSHARELISREPSPSPAPQHGNEPARPTAPQTRPALAASAQMPPAKTRPADTAFTQSSMPQRAIAMNFAARWPDRSEFTNVNVSEPAVMSNSYADLPGATDAEDELPFRSFDSETGPRQQNPAGETAFQSVLFAAALGLVSLTVVGGGFELARRAGQPFLRASWRAVAGRPDLLRRMRADLTNLTDSSPLQERYAVRRGAKLTDPVQDLKASLSELMGDLRRATAASYSPRSFAPPARQMHERITDKNQVSLDAHFGFARDDGRVRQEANQERSVATREVLEMPAIA